jgi:hypothetical protein
MHIINHKNSDEISNRIIYSISNIYKNFQGTEMDLSVSMDKPFENLTIIGFYMH